MKASDKKHKTNKFLTLINIVSLTIATSSPANAGFLWGIVTGSAISPSGISIGSAIGASMHKSKQHLKPQTQNEDYQLETIIITDTDSGETFASEKGKQGDIIIIIPAGEDRRLLEISSIVKNKDNKEVYTLWTYSKNNLRAQNIDAKTKPTEKLSLRIYSSTEGQDQEIHIEPKLFQDLYCENYGCSNALYVKFDVTSKFLPPANNNRNGGKIKQINTITKSKNKP